jgi:hypothetical protein
MNGFLRAAFEAKIMLNGEPFRPAAHRRILCIVRRA